MEPFELVSDRVHLSMPVEDDIDRIYELCQHSDISEWTAMPAPYERRHAEEFVRQVVPREWAAGTALTWAVRQPSDERVLGMIGVMLSGDGKGDVGFWLAPEARGKGLISNALRLIADRLFTDASLAVSYLTWWAYVGNWASRRVAWATGFQHEGTVRGAQPQRGRRRDSWVATLRAGDPMQPSSRWLDVPTLHGEGVMLRPYDESDADAMTEMCRDPESQWWLSNLPRPYTPDDALAWIERTREDAASGRATVWAIAWAQGGASIGSCSVRLHGPRGDTGVLGYMVHPAARGRGVAFEAARLMVRHAFISEADGGLGLRRLVVEHADGNAASRKVIERLGFRYCGMEREAARLGDGRFVGHHRYDLLAREFS